MQPLNSRFNDRHPELLPGEVFVQNVLLEVNDFTGEQYKYWRDIRVGAIAYDRAGRTQDNLKPVFGIRMPNSISEKL